MNNLPGGSPAGGSYDPNDPNVKWVSNPSGNLHRDSAMRSTETLANHTDVQLSNMMESCYAKTAMAGVAGFGLGGMFGIFMASVSFLLAPISAFHVLSSRVYR
jgi:import inner membrane translocase subunit TIM22